MGGGHLSLTGKAHGRALTRWWKGARPVRGKSRRQTNATHQRTHMASKTPRQGMVRRPKSQGNPDGDAHMQGERKELRKWGRRDIITGTAYTEHSNTEAPKTPDVEATPQALGVRKRGRKPSDYPPIIEREECLRPYQSSGSEGDIIAAGGKKKRKNTSGSEAEGDTLSVRGNNAHKQTQILQ